MDFLKFDFLKYRKIYIICSIILTVFSLWFLLFWKVNLGIDLTWWIQAEYSYKNNLTVEKVKETLEKEKENFLVSGEKIINNINVYKTTGQNTISVTTWFKNLADEKTLEKIKTEYRQKALEKIKAIDNSVTETTYQNIWKSFWDYIKYTAYLTLSLAILWMFIYVYYAFSWSISWITWFAFWFVTLLTLFHDVIGSAWLYFFFGMFFPGLQVDIYFITALLTILGYSINDTIVIFDRIRENLKKFAWKEKNGKNLYEIINLSVLETFKRSIFTSLTLVFVLITILLFWPESLRWFIFVMLLWTFVWTLSSIFLASPILYEMNKNKKLEVYKEKAYNPDDKIVV